MILTLIIVVSGTIGDLVESLLKRNAGVKDSGTIFPGHGGVLDRFDSIIFATPMVFVYLNLI
jgi:phosphatidate cytidylyltransferase